MLEHARAAALDEREKIDGLLRTYGLAVVPRAAPAGIVTVLNREFDELLSNADAFGFQRDRAEGINNVRVIPKRLGDGSSSALQQFFRQPAMAVIAQDFYQGHAVGLNHQIFVGTHMPTNAALDRLPFVLHFDKIRTLKFFLYLTDTTAADGAIEVVPGSHLLNAQRRKEYGEAPVRENLARAYGAEPQAFPVEGSAGTMLIFDTDVYHRAGQVMPGHARRVMRGHTRTLQEIERIGLIDEVY